MGVDAVEPPEPGGYGPGAPQVGDLDPPRVAHDDAADDPEAVHEDPDLAGDFVGDEGEFPPQLGGDELTGWYFAAVEPLEGPYLLGLQAGQTAGKLGDSGSPPLRRTGSEDSLT